MWSEQTDLLGAMRKCWADVSGHQFEAFCSSWRRFMTVDLAQFTCDPMLVDQVCEVCHAEYRLEFSAPYDGEFDYALYFRAIAYSHFSHTLDDRGLRKLLRVSGASTPLGPNSSSSDMCHEMCVVVFAALLTLEDRCAGYLLDVCFELAEATDQNGCFGELSTRLAGIQ